MICNDLSTEIYVREGLSCRSSDSEFVRSTTTEQSSCQLLPPVQSPTLSRFQSRRPQPTDQQLSIDIDIDTCFPSQTQT